jgi:hypothetical protein
MVWNRKVENRSYHRYGQPLFPGFVGARYGPEGLMRRFRCLNGKPLSVWKYTPNY